MKQEIERNLELRRAALKDLRESTELLKQASERMKTGRQLEVKQLREIARAKRFRSTLLMNRANRDKGY